MITRKDIAQRANVSISVVSRALNNSGYVEAEKKKRILKIADELGYHPNPVAMSLAQRKTKQILFFCKDIENAFNIELYEGMLEVAGARGYMVLIFGNQKYDFVRDIMMDGIIFANENSAQHYVNKWGKNYYLPAVTPSYGNPINFYKSIPMVECDLWEGGKMVMEYLLNRGHEKIAMISPYPLSNLDVRCYAWIDYMKQIVKSDIREYFIGIDKHTLNGDKRVLVFREEYADETDFFPEDYHGKGMLAAEIFVERNVKVTAVIVYNDEMAFGFAKRIKELGYKIPDDISVISFDGVFSRKYADIELTSLCLHPKMQGEKCAKVLIDIIEGKKYKYVTHVPLTILEGKSVRRL